MALEPLSRKRDNTIKRTGLLEEMRGTWHELQPLFASEPRHRRPVQSDDAVIEASHDQQRRCLHQGKYISRQIGPTAARHDGPDGHRFARCCNKRSRCPRTRPEQPDGKVSRPVIVTRPSDRIGNALPQQCDVKHLVAILAFIRREKVEKKGPKATVLQRPGNMLVSRAQPTAAAPMRKDDKAMRLVRQREHGLKAHRTHDLGRLLDMHVISIVNTFERLTTGSPLTLIRIKRGWWQQ
jgi:hypothetical protein